MRGAAMPNLARRSASMMSSVRPRPSCVSACETSLSGRCVVASATRNCATPVTAAGAPASIITTCGVPVRSAKYSVWPENGTPASLMVLFCRGAVTTAANQPARVPSMAASSVASTARPFSLSRVPGTTCAASGMSMAHSRSAPKWGTPLLRTACSDRALMRMAGSSAWAVIARKAASPSSTQLTCSRKAHAARIAISGPMPAGSPVVMQIVGRCRALPCVMALLGFLQVFGAVLDVGTVAHFALEVLGRLDHLALAQRHACFVALLVLRLVLGLALDDLDQAVAEAGLDRAADLTRLQFVHGLLEFGQCVTRHQPTEEAALLARLVVRVQPRQFLEGGGLVVQALLQFQQAALGIGRAQGRRDLQQDMAGMGLLHGRLGLGLGHAALVGQLQDMEAADALDDLGDLARLQLDQGLGEHGRNAVSLAPAHHAALQRIGRVGAGGGHLGEVGAGAQLAHHFLGALLALGNHVGRGILGNTHEA